MDLVGDAMREIVLFLPNSSLNRLRQINFVFLQAIRRRIAQLSPSTLKTSPICKLKTMADEENKMDALKYELEKIKRDVRKGRFPGMMFGALALMLTLLEKLRMVVGLDSGFKIPFPSMSAIASATMKDIYREIYEEEPDEEMGLDNENDFLAAIEYCTDEGMLHPRFDGNYQFTPRTQWQSYKKRKERRQKRKEEEERREARKKREEAEKRKEERRKRKRGGGN